MSVTTFQSARTVGPAGRVSSILTAVPMVPGHRKPLAVLPNDPIRPSVEDVVKSSYDLMLGEDSRDEVDMSLSFVKEYGDDDEESTYESVASTADSYHTAPAPSEKEIHSDLIYCVPEYADDIYVYLRGKEMSVCMHV